MIPQSFVQDLLARVDIVDVIDPLVPLKRAGANLAACCPFHGEKTPSFTVSPSKQFYHCFGCGAHGSAVGFLMEHLGLGFVDAIKELAGRVGMSVPEAQFTTDAPASRSRVEGLLPVMEHAQRFYKKELKRSERAIEYLKSRGLSGEIAARYGVGYAPEGWQNLSAVFERYDSHDLAEAGLVIDNDSGKRYDRFRDRIMFPISDAQGRVIGFGGRVLNSGEPKYLNSPETPLFEKGREVYGLFQARQAIRAAGRVVVVEGYMDVVALAQFGVQYAVATLGTATTPTHVQKLLRQTDEIVFCFDGDNAGRRASWRALENSIGQIKDGKQIRFLFLPEGEDPDSYVRRFGPEGFVKLLASESLALSAFLLRELTGRVDMATAEGKAKFLEDVKPLLGQISAPLLALTMRKRVAEVSGLAEAEVLKALQLRPAAEVRARVPNSPRLRSAFRTFLEILAYRPQLAGSITDLNRFNTHGLELIQVTSLELEFLHALLPALRAGGEKFNLTEAFRGTTLEAVAQEVERSTMEWDELGLDEGQLKQDLEGAWRAMQEQVRKARQRGLMEALKERGWTPEEKEQFRLLQQPVI
ncbi:MAG: DNA primase [Betaproteobacteria bacterium]|nr:DNA primase [Betaproteobacteria bacterium]